MGWAERANETPSTEPRALDEAALRVPSEFLEQVTRGMLVDCMKAAGEIQGLMNPPKIVGPSGGAAGPAVNPVSVLLASQVRVLHAQAATLDLLRTFLGLPPELRPVKREDDERR